MRTDRRRHNAPRFAHRGHTLPGFRGVFTTDGSERSQTEQGPTTRHQNLKQCIEGKKAAPGLPPTVRGPKEGGWRMTRHT